MYAYLASFVMMPAVHGADPGLRTGADRSALKQSLIAFAIVIAPLVLWHLTHPERLAVFSGHQLGGAGETD